jgi:hypothetical protein
MERCNIRWRDNILLTGENENRRGFSCAAAPGSHLEWSRLAKRACGSTAQADRSCSGFAELEPVVVVLASDSPADRIGKMRRENDPISVCMLSEKPVPRPSRPDRIDAEPGAPVQIAKLQRMMHEIGAEDRFTPSALDPDRLDEHACRDAMSIVDQFGLPRRE